VAHELAYLDADDGVDALDEAVAARVLGAPKAPANPRVLMFPPRWIPLSLRHRMNCVKAANHGRNRDRAPLTLTALLLPRAVQPARKPCKAPSNT
jgi:hypothetical protein